jgi:hypothetical protein
MDERQGWRGRKGLLGQQREEGHGQWVVGGEGAAGDVKTQNAGAREAWSCL